jgi:amino acid adenylation domain-containing protein
MENIENAYQLTPAQAGMLFHVLDSPESNVYMACVALNVKGAIDVSRLRESWNAVFQKHEALRAAFLWEGLDEPLQVIHSVVELPWQVDYLHDRATAPDTDELIAIGKEEFYKPFDISEAPLSRVRLVQTAESEWKMIWSVHHLLADGWCTPIILSDLVSYYASLGTKQSNGNGIEIVDEVFSFSEHVAWLAEQDNEAALAHWRDYLSGVQSTPLRLERIGTVDAQSTGEGGAYARQSSESAFTLGVEETRDIGQFCRQNQLTLSTLIHLSWGLVLSEYCDTDKPLFGSVSAGRQSGLAGIEKAVGLFLNTLPVFIDFGGAQPVLELLHDLQKSMHRNNQFEFTALADIQKTLLRSRNEPLFESIVSMESHTGDVQFTEPGVDICISDIEYSTRSNFGLSLLVVPGTEIRLSLNSDNNELEQNYLELMLPRLVTMIRAVISSPQSSANEVLKAPMLLQQPLQQSKGNSVVDVPHVHVHRWFENTCDTYPEKLAVVSSSSRLTFAQLDKQANQVARALSKRVTEQDALIGVMLPRSCDLVVAFLGVLKSGLAYVPLAPDLPDTKISQIIKSADIRWVIGAQPWPEMLVNNDVNVLTLEQCQSEDDRRLPVADSRAAVLDSASDEQSVAYVMFTSGSTGTPKGVMVNHSNLIYSSGARINYYARPDPIFLLLSAMTFDSSVAGLYWSLCGGGTVVLPGTDEEKDLDIVGSLIKQYGVTHTLCLPSFYRLILQYVEAVKLESLQVVIVAGEQCMPIVVSEHQAKLPACRLFNEYGPTEATVWSTVAELSSEPSVEISIGHPIGDTLILLLSSSGRLCPPGVIGEIYIGGRGVAAGYYLQVSQTAEHFINNPINAAEYTTLFRTGDSAYRDSSGALIFVGRRDRQLKIRGNRIEPAEVESVLIDFPSVTDVVVIGHSLVQHNDSNAPRLIPGVEQLTQVLNTLSEDKINRLLQEAERT